MYQSNKTNTVEENRLCCALSDSVCQFVYLIEKRGSKRGEKGQGSTEEG